MFNLKILFSDFFFISASCCVVNLHAYHFCLKDIFSPNLLKPPQKQTQGAIHYAGVIEVIQVLRNWVSLPASDRQSKSLIQPPTQTWVLPISTELGKGSFHSWAFRWGLTFARVGKAALGRPGVRRLLNHLGLPVQRFRLLWRSANMSLCISHATIGSQKCTGHTLDGVLSTEGDICHKEVWHIPSAKQNKTKCKKSGHLY